ncbi:MAG: TetR/AcrR family transcriptional regulator [Desulfobacterales bacterium]|nr:TetR/AcrR family transcriptional regulator [Desulfobacterales bacterium]MBF0395543.1 TetR/AcrR family transcriptional regulator [Desulfobacterales bacterium]
MNIHSLSRDKKLKVTKRSNNDKYNRILEAAVKVFSTLGFFQSTVSQIAKEAGVADGTIYLYFKNKEDILGNVFSYKTKQVFDQFREEVNKAERAKDKLLSLIKRHLEEFERDKNLANLYLVETYQKVRTAEDQIKEMSKMYLDIISEIVKLGQNEGTIRTDLDITLVKRFIIGAVHEVIFTWVRSANDYRLSFVAEELVELIIKGIGTCDKRKK